MLSRKFYFLSSAFLTLASASYGAQLRQEFVCPAPSEILSSLKNNTVSGLEGEILKGDPATKEQYRFSGAYAVDAKEKFLTQKHPMAFCVYEQEGKENMVLKFSLSKLALGVAKGVSLDNSFIQGVKEQEFSQLSGWKTPIVLEILNINRCRSNTLQGCKFTFEFIRKGLTLSGPQLDSFILENAQDIEESELSSLLETKHNKLASIKARTLKVYAQTRLKGHPERKIPLANLLTMAQHFSPEEAQEILSAETSFPELRGKELEAYITKNKETLDEGDFRKLFEKDKPFIDRKVLEAYMDARLKGDPERVKTWRKLIDDAKSNKWVPLGIRTSLTAKLKRFTGMKIERYIKENMETLDEAEFRKFFEEANHTIDTKVLQRYLNTRLKGDAKRVATWSKLLSDANKNKWMDRKTRSSLSKTLKRFITKQLK